MRRMRFLELLGIGIFLVVFLILAYLFLWREYEINKGVGSSEVKLMKHSLTERVRVVDARTGQTILIYEDGFGVTLDNVERLPDGQFRVTLTDHSLKTESTR